MKSLYFYVEDERTIGVCELTEEYYQNAKIYRNGEWVKTAPLELVAHTRPCDRAFAERHIGKEALSKA